MTISELKQQLEYKTSATIKECGVFFAFSKEQFQKNKTPLQEGEKYVDIGMGGFIPKSKLDKWQADMDANQKWYEDQIKEHNLRRDLIIYELYNHECFYTGSISGAVDALGDDFTREEIAQAFQEERNNAYQNM